MSEYQKGKNHWGNRDFYGKQFRDLYTSLSITVVAYCLGSLEHDDRNFEVII